MLRLEPLEIRFPDADLDDLHRRLSATRFATTIADPDWDAGTDIGFMRRLVDHWVERFDWREAEARLDRFEHQRTEVDGQPIHFVHARSPHPDATPLLLVHGWPGSVAEFLDVLGPLTDPVAHGGDAKDAFHVVAPSLPGYGFSGPTLAPGWHARRIAHAFVQIMDALGYDRFGAQGGDWGYLVTSNVADLVPDRVLGLHLNFVVARSSGDPATLTETERQDLDALRTWRRSGAGYQEIQGTKPHTLGVGLEDSPAGLAAWIVEKFRDWSDCDGDVERSFTLDQLLTNITTYWLTRTATSSCRLYYEARRAGPAGAPQAYIGVPTGIANFPAEITKPPRAWVEAMYDVVHWTHPQRGGHFAAMEVPDLWVDDVRTFFRSLSRSTSR